MQDTALQKFQRFKEMYISSNIPNDVLLELMESYIKSEDTDMAASENPILDGQLSLFDLAV